MQTTPLEDRQQIIRAAEDAFRAPGEPHDLRGLYGSLRCFATSDHGDTAAVTWNALYHRGRAPYDVRRSRGHSLKVRFHRDGPDAVVRVTDPYDHRNGIQWEAS